jgi:sensor histidine kinase YesM
MPATTKYEENLNKSSGIGIENVKKRLELGYNKNDYKLSIKNKKNNFVVKLIIRVS